MYTESCKCLGGALAKSNVAQLDGLCNIENVLYGIRNIMPGKVVYARNRISNDDDDVTKKVGFYLKSQNLEELGPW